MTNDKKYIEIELRFLTLIADSKYLLSNEEIAISFKALSDRIPSQLSKLRNSFNALLNCRWKNEHFASCSLKKKSQNITMVSYKQSIQIAC